jgi:hypothetical protein
VVTRVLAAATLAIGAVGCGGHELAPPGKARLHVVQLVAKGSPLAIEGAYHCVRVHGDSGSLERRLSDELTPQATLRLPAGRYRLESWQRTCDGNCGYVDQPSDRCAGRFELEPHRRLEATITVTYGSGCRIAFG